ncbi:hypothetical protein AVEN_234259-1 [Araneus ventricosus]|uniref:Uncharacterized protein n=1 Tax=Araneus ventricosus TaxID=182803 RepID=A0A4Y2A9K2_ARAVE|nr:hypothetical protein AVEN_234259-1 [Araneus ventricosus]
MWLGPEILKLIICLWHGMFQEKGEERRGFYVLICWTPEVVRKREAAVGGIVKRLAKFSTDTAVLQVFSESEKIGWERPLPCDKLDELSLPVMTSKSYIFMTSYVEPLMPSSQRICHLASARCLRSCFALLLGRGTVSIAVCLHRHDCLFGQLISFLIPQVPYVSFNPIQPDVMSVVQRVLNEFGY